MTGGRDDVIPLTVKPRPSSSSSPPLGESNHLGSADGRAEESQTGNSGESHWCRRSGDQEVRRSGGPSTDPPFPSAGPDHEPSPAGGHGNQLHAQTGEQLRYGLVVPPCATGDLQPPPTAGGVEVTPVTCSSAYLDTFSLPKRPPPDESDRSSGGGRVGSENVLLLTCDL